MLERRLNHRSDFNYRLGFDTYNISDNFYPVTSAISITDPSSGLSMSLFNDRPQSASSLTNGTLQILLNRRIKSQDGLGMSEPLDEH